MHDAEAELSRTRIELEARRSDLEYVRTIHALGLRRIRATVVHDDTPVIRGMIARVAYALRVEPADDASTAGAGGRAQKTKERSA